ncbi:MAG: DUF5060 domain-containing protein, partial [Atribacterota bacterium]
EDKLLQWQPFVLKFTAADTYKWNEFPLQVVFRQDAKKICLDGYWDGENNWKVSFAAPTSGEWTWETNSEDSSLKGKQGVLSVDEVTKEDTEANSNFKGHVKVVDGERYFAYSDGTHFLLLGDTNWAINMFRCGIKNPNFAP